MGVLVSETETSLMTSSRSLPRATLIYPNTGLQHGYRNHCCDFSGRSRSDKKATRVQPLQYSDSVEATHANSSMVER
jgi:hypothetical protein